MKVHVDEISHCNPNAGFCGPGFRTDLGSHDVTRRAIVPELAFELYFRHADEIVASVGFKVDYDAPSWTRTQRGRRGVIQDH